MFLLFLITVHLKSRIPKKLVFGRCHICVPSRSPAHTICAVNDDYVATTLPVGIAADQLLRPHGTAASGLS